MIKIPERIWICRYDESTDLRDLAETNHEHCRRKQAKKCLNDKLPCDAQAYRIVREGK